MCESTLKAICQGYYREYRKIVRTWDQLQITGEIKVGNPHGTKPRRRKTKPSTRPLKRQGTHKTGAAA